MASDFRVTGDLDPIIEHLDGLAEGIDFTPLAGRVREIMLADNARARGAGLDKDDDQFVPLRGGRALKPSEVSRRGGSGPPLAPQGDGSRIVTDFTVGITPMGDGAVLIVGSWPSMPWLVYHADGRGHNPVRDPVGVTPEGSAAIAAAVREYLAELLGAS